MSLLARTLSAPGRKLWWDKVNQMNLDERQAHVEALYRMWQEEGGFILGPNSQGLLNWDRWDGRLWKTEDLGRYRQAWHHQFANHAMASIDSVLRRMPVSRLREVDHFSLLHHQATLQAYNKLDPYFRIESELNSVLFLLRTAPQRLSQRFKETVLEMESISSGYEIDIRNLLHLQQLLGHVQHNRPYFKHRAIVRQSSAEVKSIRHRIMTRQKRYRLRLKEFVGQRRHMQGLDVPAYIDQESRQLSWELNLAKLEAAALRQSLFDWNYIIAIPIGEAFAVRIVARLETIIIKCKKFRERRQPRFRNEIDWIVKPQQRLLGSLKENVECLRLLVFDLQALLFYRVSKFPSSISDKEVELNKSLKEKTAPGLKERISDLSSKWPSSRSKYYSGPSTTKNAMSFRTYRSLPRHPGLAEKTPTHDNMEPKPAEAKHRQSSQPESKRAQNVLKAGEFRQTASIRQVQRQTGSAEVPDKVVPRADAARSSHNNMTMLEEFEHELSSQRQSSEGFELSGDRLEAKRSGKVQSEKVELLMRRYVSSRVEDRAVKQEKGMKQGNRAKQDKSGEQERTVGHGKIIKPYKRAVQTRKAQLLPKKKSFEVAGQSHNSLKVQRSRELQPKASTLHPPRQFENSEKHDSAVTQNIEARGSRKKKVFKTSKHPHIAKRFEQGQSKKKEEVAALHPPRQLDHTGDREQRLKQKKTAVDSRAIDLSKAWESYKKSQRTVSDPPR